MKSKVILSLFLTLSAMLAISSAPKAEASDVRFSVGVGGGGRHYYRPYGYSTYDTGYTTWYPSDSTYVYSDPYASSYSYPSYSSSYYSTPYVYSSPSIEFNTWYGGGYSHGGSYYGGHSGYGGGYRSSGGHRR